MLFDTDHSFWACDFISILADRLSVYFSLAVRDLSNLVKPEDIVTSEHLTTLLAIVPKYSQKDWLSSYETLTSYVVKLPYLLSMSNPLCYIPEQLYQVILNVVLSGSWMVLMLIWPVQ